MDNIVNLGWDNFFENNLSNQDKADFVIARVIAEHKNAFAIHDGIGEHRAILSGKFFHAIEKTSDMPVVGDWVLLHMKPESNAIIERILPRKSALTRRAPNNRKTFGNDGEQIIASNIDIVFIVTGLNQNFNLSRIERALALVYTSGAKPVVLLSKADLCNDAETKINMVEEIAFGVPVISFSNINMDNIDIIQNMILPGKTACLLGSSGVGKTSLMNILCNRAEKTLEIREKDARGRHATTSRSLYILSNGGMIIDTPGIREIGLAETVQDIDDLYVDIETIITQCRFSNCSHTNEPGCAVLEAIEKGELDKRRFRNYLKVQKESAFQNDKATARKEKQEKYKKIAKLARVLNK